MSDKVKVAVRVRPLNRREINLATKCVVDMDSNQTILHYPNQSDGGSGRKSTKTFAFDHCFWSMLEDNPKYANQDRVFECLGQDVLDRSFEGYNGCIFAYGQTGSGKSYTMMGTSEQKGIIPRLCDMLFEKIAANKDVDLSFKVEVSYMEIYNEKVHDLLDPKGVKKNLKVREHNILGPYVDGLSALVVSNYQDIDSLMNEGNKSRTVASTNMNSESSRSHAVFNIIVTQTLVDPGSMVSGEKVSKLSLVDLAGSERAQKSGAVGDRLKEGSNINKSLVTLGLVISALAEASGKTNKAKFVPYRDSVLTWLLKDNLGGNSKTVMVATISPSGDNYEETLSTLRYADRAKSIINHAVVNEDPNARIIRELREEVDALRIQLDKAQSMQAPDLQDRLAESEKLMKDITKTWEEKLLETEQIHQERHSALEQMGISVEMSGIKVESARFFLVNLNADPSLNELLVYYLKEHTLVGRPDAPVQQDIQLSGLAIAPEHCIVDLENTDVFITPFDNARTCVNGSIITQKTRVKNGDRILWGNNHFFRINCPKTNSPQTAEPEERLDYDFAQQELMMKELGDDPIQEAISAIEKQHEEDKQEALDRQKQMYERQMQMLRSQLISPSTPSLPFPQLDFNRLNPTQSNIHRKYQQWAQERDKMFKQSLVKLRDEVVKANTLVREANFLAQEMGKVTKFHVTLQIPAANLSPNRRRGAFVSEPAILVRREGHDSQIWSMDKFENKTIDMREMYEERLQLGLPMMDNGRQIPEDPFYESQENHNLIGVANVFLDCLFHNVKLVYPVPIISQQGEVAGKLQVEISKLGGTIPSRYSDLSSEGSDDNRRMSVDDYEDDGGIAVGAPLLICVSLKAARGLPISLSNFVFCQYSFWGHPDPVIVPPKINPDTSNRRKNDSTTCYFDHSVDFKVQVTEEFIEHASEGALSIEVWGHRIQGFGNSLYESDSVQARSWSLMDRWSEVMRKLEMLVEIHELNDQGDYCPVEVAPKPEVLSAGVFQLRQGHSRRIQVRVKPVANSGTLPLICDSISSISVGCICARSKLQKGLDSYQEEDLNLLKERWSEALERRKEYLDKQIQTLIHKEDKSDADADRERALIDQWVILTEERNDVLVPAAGSGIPGAPADWDALPDMEQHIPVLFLGLNADDMSTPSAKEGLQAAGVNSILPKEHRTKFINLPITRHSEKELCAVASWDSSIHDDAHLNRLTAQNERVYLILMITMRLSHPASMELVLRKRICINIYKKQGLTTLTDMLKKKISRTDCLYSSGVTYEVVSNIPKASEDLEDMETLAQMAASQNEVNSTDGETYIEKYIKGISAVESILTLDRLRQEVAVKELLSASGKSLRKTTSVPNIHQLVTSPTRLDDHVRADSIQDLSLQDQSMLSASFAAKSAMSPMATNFVPMRTVLEEQQHREMKPLLRQDTEDDLDEVESKSSSPMRKLTDFDNEDFQEFESYDSQQVNETKNGMEAPPSGITHSTTVDSLNEICTKNVTPSMISSGYGSEAVSTHTLPSDEETGVEAGTKDRKSHTDSFKSDSLESTGSESDFDEKAATYIVDDLKEKLIAENVDNSDETVNKGDKVLNVSEHEDKCDHSKLMKEDSSRLREVSIADSVQDKDHSIAKLTLLLNKGGSLSDDSLCLMDEGIPQMTHIPLKPVPSPPTNGSFEMPDTSLYIDEESLLAGDLHEKVAGPEGFVDKLQTVPSDSNSSTSECSLEKDLEAVDAYSEMAMEELERLAQNGSGDDAADSMAQPLKKTKDVAGEFVKTNRSLFTDSLPLTTRYVMKKSNSVDQKLTSSQHFQSRTPDGRSSRGSVKRQRPTSCIASPQSDALSISAAYEDLVLRSSYATSDDYMSGGDDSASLCSFGSRADLDRLHDVPTPSWIQIGVCVTVNSSRSSPKMGVVQFVGNVEFASGPWVGVELDSPEGKNNGTVNGVRYFKCRPWHGIFVRHDKLIWDRKRRGSRKGNAAHRRSMGNLSNSKTNLSQSASNLAQASGADNSFMKSTASSSAKKK